jgi:NAD+ diphosphatase
MPWERITGRRTVMSMYPEMVNLTYNYASLGNLFVMGSPRTVHPPVPGYWVAIRGNSILLNAGSGHLALPEGDIPGWLQPRSEHICIGVWKQKPIQAFFVEGDVDIRPPLVAEPFGTITPQADDATISVCGLAHQILHWEKRSRFCSSCGGETEWYSDGWGRRCRVCRAKQFPASNPCAIVLVRRGHEVLLIHKPEWTDGRYSIPSGFVDLGESLEECAVREVREETGIEIRNLCYVGSQNWPFPSSLMSGFVADYAGGELQIEIAEIDDARWFPLDRLPTLPSKRSIARRMIDRFCSLQHRVP